MIEKLSHDEYNNMFEIIGLEKAIQFYNYSKEEYDAVGKVINFFPLNKIQNEIKKELEIAQVSDIKKICFDYVRKNILISSYNLQTEKFPEMFVMENKDIFLIDVSLPDDVRKRYFKRHLTVDDLIDYEDVFQKFPIDSFMSDRVCVHRFFWENYGIGKFQELVKQHPDLFLHMQNESYVNGLYNFEIMLKDELMLSEFNLDMDTCFKRAVKKYCSSSLMSVKNSDSDDLMFYVPRWLSSMNFKFIPKLETIDDLLNYDESVFLRDRGQTIILNAFNIENIKKFDQETKFFSHTFDSIDLSPDLLMFNSIVDYFNVYSSTSIVKFKNGGLSYKKFKDEFAKLLDDMRRNNVFTDFPSYDFIQGKFREEHPEIFIDEKAKEKFKIAFYNNKITPRFLHEHKDCIPYLLDKNLLNTIKANIKLSRRYVLDEHNNYVLSKDSENFIEEYVKRYGNEKLLKLISKYGSILSNMIISPDDNKIDNEEEMEKSIRKCIYEKIIRENVDYSYLADVKELVDEYPEIFVDFDDLNIPIGSIAQLQSKFYNRELSFDDIKRYPKLVELLKDKNLFIAFGNKNDPPKNSFNEFVIREEYDLELLKVFGNEKFLELCSIYGRYMDAIGYGLRTMGCYRFEDNNYYAHSDRSKKVSFEEICKAIEKNIAKKCVSGEFDYKEEDAPGFLKQEHPELFLDESAPALLKELFYGNYNFLTFSMLSMHKEWLPYLEGKSIEIALKRDKRIRYKVDRLFSLFGKEKTIELGIKKPETVTAMINDNKVEIMRLWYDRTGCKFIPDVVIMQNIDISNADKFLSNTTSWNKLMKLNDFSGKQEIREAMLKLAYSFGVFDGDKRGFTKIYDLLTKIPKKIDESTYHKIKDFYINQSNDLIEEFENALKEEVTNIDCSKDIISQLYRKNEDNTYTLVINQQNCPKTIRCMRKILSEYSLFLTPEKIHQLFGGFELIYDKDFREFLLNNLDEILNNTKYTMYISGIQKQFQDIKTVNSNRKLTLDLAISYIKNNKYQNINIGNEKVAEISAIAGYTQSDFNILQKIYNYGKQRVFSSIPRIEGHNEKYSYEMLRLDDPLAMAIGTLTDCCQEIGNAAEVCMEHSMVDKNGRVFVVRDKEGNIVAQSWVWRNKDVLCFDNIEIPNKAFSRERYRKEFADEVYEVYIDAAKELIEQDEKEYKKLLDEGKITEEQYDGLRLGKITVGLGYNDIAKSITNNSKVDKTDIARPIEFSSPIELSRGLYTDSTTQYILEERKNRKEYDGLTYPIHSDTYIEYDDSNFKEKELISLKKLEKQTKGYSYNLDYVYNSDKIVSEIADNYDLNSRTTKVILHPNFAIIYEDQENKVVIGDLFYNTKINNKEQKMDIDNIVVMQIRLALDQIGKDKEIDVSNLDNNQKEMYDKAINLKDEIDIERGIAHGK